MITNNPDSNEQGEALERFRKSVGFQFQFVMYSGLDVKTAIDHICASAEVLFAARRASVAAGEGDAALIVDLQRELAYFLGQYHGNTNHRDDVLRCMENECVRIRQLLATASSPAPAEPNDSCSHWRDGDSDNCVWCGDDLGPTTEADVATEPLQPEGEQEPRATKRFQWEELQRLLIQAVVDQQPVTDRVWSGRVVITTNSENGTVGAVVSAWIDNDNNDEA